MKRDWKHKTRVFKTETGWTWTCYHVYCPNFSVHPDHAAILTRAGVADQTACAVGGTADNLPGTPAAPGSACTENGLVATVYSYPASTAIPAVGNPGIVAAAGLSTIFNPTLTNLQDEGYSASLSGTVTTFQVQGAPDAANCQFTYTQAASAAIPAVISAAITTGC